MLPFTVLEVLKWRDKGRQGHHCNKKRACPLVTSTCGSPFNKGCGSVCFHQSEVILPSTNNSGHFNPNRWPGNYTLNPAPPFYGEGLKDRTGRKLLYVSGSNNCSHCHMPLPSLYPNEAQSLGAERQGGTDRHV